MRAAFLFVDFPVEVSNIDSRTMKCSLSPEAEEERGLKPPSQERYVTK